MVGGEGVRAGAPRLIFAADGGSIVCHTQLGGTAAAMVDSPGEVGTHAHEDRSRVVVMRGKGVLLSAAGLVVAVGGCMACQPPHCGKAAHILDATGGAGAHLHKDWPGVVVIGEEEVLLSVAGLVVAGGS